ncbi:MAG: type II and III secretion system protein family protein [Pseudomonadota bacterium]
MGLKNRLLAAALPVAAGVLAAPALPESPPGVALTQPGESAVTQRTVIALNKSTVVELDRPAADVVITNPLIADAAVQTSRRIIFRGVEVGQTNAFIFDNEGNQLLNLEINVERDLSGLDELIKKHVPDARIKAEAVNNNVVLTGLVDSQSQQDAVLRLAAAYIGSDDTDGLVNMMSIGAGDQVLLRVRIVEMQRSVVKQLGINFTGTTNFGELASQTLAQLFTFDPALGVLVPALDGNGDPLEGLVGASPFSNQVGGSVANGFSISGAPLGGLSGSATYSNFVDGILQSSVGAGFDALERVGIVRTLAEPNMTAISGETANFLAGGEFPVPVAQDEFGRISVEFKPFGVGLGFTPVVLSEGRISLKLSTEVSELTTNGAFQGSATTAVDPTTGDVVSISGLSIPALTVRRAETTVEMPSGGSMMIAGLIQSDTRQALDGVPGAKDIPILGALFRSRDFVNEETELVIIVTPYLVDPASPGDFGTPADGFRNPSDAKTIFFGKLNRMYGKPGVEEDGEDYRAPVGFIEE